MNHDDEWVANVKRWCLEQNTQQREPTSSSSSTSTPPDASFDDELGYETAHPALQARHWPDAPPRL